MPRLLLSKWQEARLYYEAGATQQATADFFGVSKYAVQKKIKKEGWTQDLERAIRRRVSEKVAKMSSAATTEQKVALIDAEAERRAVVNTRHEQLWAQATQLQQDAVGEKHEEDGKFHPDPALQRAAKLNADTVAVIITGERRVYRLDDTGPVDESPRQVIFVSED